MEQQHAIRYLALSQEELIDAGAFDLQMSIAALEKGLLDFEKGKILFRQQFLYNGSKQDSARNIRRRRHCGRHNSGGKV